MHPNVHSSMNYHSQQQMIGPSTDKEDVVCIHTHPHTQIEYYSGIKRMQFGGFVWQSSG